MLVSRIHPRFAPLLVGALLLLALTAASARAADGDSDPRYGDADGVVPLNGTFGAQFNSEFLLDAAGRTVVVAQNCAGSAQCPDGSPPRAIAYAVDAGGEVDTTWGHDGYATPRLGNAGGSPTAALADGTGRVVIAESATALFGTLAPVAGLVRLTANGTVDDTFGSAGRVYLEPDGMSGVTVNSMAPTADGGLLVTLTATAADGSRPFMAAKLKADGTLDSNFGSGGYAEVAFQTTTPVVAEAVRAVELSGGDIVIIGDGQTNAGRSALLVARLHPGGALDTTFGSGGRLYDFGGASANATITATDAIVTGNDLVIGAARSDPQNAVLVRVDLATGRRDTTFGTGGLVALPATAGDFGYNPRPQQIAAQADGRLLVTFGASDSAGYNFGAVARLTATGVLDLSWAQDGIKEFLYDPSNEGDIGTSYGAMLVDDALHTVLLEVNQFSFGAYFANTQRLLLVDDRPSPSFTAMPTAPPPGTQLDLDGSASVPGDPNSPITDYRWRVGGSAAVSTGTNAHFHATVTGSPHDTVPVSLTVVDSRGLSATSARSITLGDAPPTPVLGAYPATTTRDTTVTIDARESNDDGPTLRYAFDLDGDGVYETDTGSGAATVQATKLGTFTVGVRVTDSAGQSATATTTYTVKDTPPVALASIDPAAPAVGAPVTLNAGDSYDSEGAIVDYRWDTDGNGTYELDAGANPTTTTTFSAAGHRLVGLQVTDADGVTAVQRVPVDVRVSRAPNAVLVVTTAKPGVGDTVELDATGSTDPNALAAGFGGLTFRFDLDGDGSYESGPSFNGYAAVNVDQAGTRTFGVQVTNSADQTSVDRVSVKVAESSATPTPTPTSSPVSDPTPTSSATPVRSPTPIGSGTPTPGRTPSPGPTASPGGDDSEHKCNDVLSTGVGNIFSKHESIDVPLGKFGKIPKTKLLVSPEVGVSLDSLAVCLQGLLRLAHLTVGDGPSIQLQTSNETGGSSALAKSFTYSLTHFAWTIPPGTGAPIAAPPADKIDWDKAVEFNPGLDFSWQRIKADEKEGEKPLLSVSLISIPIAARNTTLISQGAAFLSASLGPELDLGVKISRETAAKEEADDEASGKSEKAARDDETGELKREINEDLKEEAEDVGGEPEPDIADEIDEATKSIGDDVESTLTRDPDEFRQMHDEELVEDEISADTEAEVEEIEGAEEFELEEATFDRFHAPTAAAAAATPVTGHLKASALPHGHHLSLTRGTFRHARVSGIVRNTLGYAGAAKVGPLAVTTKHLRPGHQLGVVATGLGHPKANRVLFDLQGPGAKYTNLLGVHHDAIGARFKLPKHLAAGTWTLAVENVAGDGHGNEVIRLATFQVKNAKGRGKKAAAHAARTRPVIGFLGSQAITPRRTGTYAVTLAPITPGADGSITLRDGNGHLLGRRPVSLTTHPFTVRFRRAARRRADRSRHLVATVTLATPRGHSSAARQYTLRRRAGA